MTQEIEHTENRTREYLILDPEFIQRNTVGEEISLFDLWSILTKKRIHIFGTFAASLVISVAIASLIAPTYQATIYFQPPQNKDIAILNIPEFDIEYTPDEVFNTFQNNFKARNNLWDFFIKKQLYKAYLDNKVYEDIDITKAFEKKFIKDMTLHQSSDNQFFINATINWKEAAEGAALLNEYSQIVKNNTAEQYADELNYKLTLEKKRDQEQIRLLRESAQRTKIYRIAELDDNINIARELGIKRWQGSIERKTSDELAGAQGSLPPYYSGYEILDAEKRSLQARKNEDPYTPGLNEKMAKLEFLNSIEIPDNRIVVARVTQQAKALPEPIKPRKIVIISIGTALGLIFGMLVAFLLHAIETSKKSK